VLLGLRWLSRAVGRASSDLPRPPLNLAIVGKIALDEFFLSSELISATFVSLIDRRRLSRELSEALKLFETRGWLEEPTAYHRDPPAVDAVRVDQFGSLWGPYQHLRFESGYEPHPDEPGRERWLSYTPNRKAHAWLLEHPGPSRPWVVCIPGYRMGSPAVDFTGFRTRWLHLELGLNVAIPVLPLHGPRSVGRRGGDGFLSGDFIDTLHAQAQAVWDSRRLVGWLRQQRAPAVGVHGVSLGGYTAALLAELEDELDCAILGNPAADFLRLMRSHVPSAILQALDKLGFSFEPVETLLRVVSPLVLPPRVAHERRYVYAAVADRLATPDHARDLWHHWDCPNLTWYEGSHVSFLWESKVKDLLEEAFRACGLLPDEASETALAS
jgi:hypothetical protein